MRLPDGRLLGWAEYGDPQGWPLLYFHGFPACRLEAALTGDAASRLGIRVVAPDRPGIGCSDFQQGRTLGDWPEDVTALADALGLKRFSVLGVSGGAPYALACAAKIPERLAAVGIVGGLGPVSGAHDTAGMAALNRLFLFLFHHTPSLGRALFAPLAKGLYRWTERLFTLFTATVPAADLEVLGRPGIRPLFHASMREAARQGTRGLAHDLFLYSHPWGVDPAALRIPIRLWHGELDVTVPAAMGRQLARGIPECREMFYPNEGHFSLPIKYMERILRTLAEST